jgi:hypothetical protein
MSEITAAIATEINPPPVAKAPKRPRHSGKPAGKRGPPRPYRRIAEEVLAARIVRLTKRIERVRRQHESTRILLTKYAHERFYRDHEAVSAPFPRDLPEDPVQPLVDGPVLP